MKKIQTCLIIIYFISYSSIHAQTFPALVSNLTLDTFKYEMKNYLDTILYMTYISNEDKPVRVQEILINDTDITKLKYASDHDTLVQIELKTNKCMMNLTNYTTGVPSNLFINLDTGFYQNVRWYDNGKLQSYEIYLNSILYVRFYDPLGNITSDFTYNLNKNKKLKGIVYNEDSKRIEIIRISKPFRHFKGTPQQKAKIVTKLRGGYFYAVGPDTYYNQDGSISEKLYFKNGIIKKRVEYIDKKRKITKYDDDGRPLN